MALILAFIGVAMSGYAMWLGWRIAHVTVLSYNPDFLLGTFGFSVTLFTAGLLVMAAAEGLHHLLKIREQQEKILGAVASVETTSQAGTEMLAAKLTAFQAQTAESLRSKRPSAAAAAGGLDRILKAKRPKPIIVPRPRLAKTAEAPANGGAAEA
jgi:hypothetical protein